nr:glycosyltransferase family 2 protein [Alphaproteobacteria bacterium]
EIICVDDCSPDGSMEIVRQFAKDDKRIKIITHKKNLRQGGARNSGIEVARGEYIFFLDPDDFLSNDTVLRDLCDIAVENDAKIVNAKFQHYNNKVGQFCKLDNSLKLGGVLLQILPDNFFELPFSATVKLYHSSVFNDKNIRFENNIIYEDVLFYFILFTKIKSVFLTNLTAIMYRSRTRSTTALADMDDNIKYDNCLKVVKLVFYYLKKNRLLTTYEKPFMKICRRFYNTMNRKTSLKFKKEVNSFLNNQKVSFKIKFPLIRPVIKAILLFVPVKLWRRKLRRMLKNEL